MIFLDVDAMQNEYRYLVMGPEIVNKYTFRKVYDKIEVRIDELPTIDSSNLVFSNAPYSMINEDRINSIKIGTSSEFNSLELAREFFCNVKDGVSVGDTFREARNSYYISKDSYYEQEQLGATLLSYGLLGNPNTNIELSNLNLCLRNKFFTSENPVEKNSKGGHIIKITEKDGKISSKTFSFPLKTVITDVEVTRRAKSKDVDFDVCETELDEGVNTFLQITPEQQILTTVVNPYLCNKQEAFHEVDYEISFISQQHYILSTESLDDEYEPGTSLEVESVIYSLTNEEFEGEFILLLDGEEVDTKIVSISTPSSVSLSFETPEEHGFHKVEVIVENEERLTSGTQIIFVDNPEKILTLFSEKTSVDEYVEFDIPLINEVKSASMKIEFDKLQTSDDFFVDSNLNVEIGESYFERRGGGLWIQERRCKLLSNTLRI